MEINRSLQNPKIATTILVLYKSIATMHCFGSRDSESVYNINYNVKVSVPEI